MVCPELFNYFVFYIFCAIKWLNLCTYCMFWQAINDELGNLFNSGIGSVSCLLTQLNDVGGGIVRFIRKASLLMRGSKRLENKMVTSFWGCPFLRSWALLGYTRRRYAQVVEPKKVTTKVTKLGNFVTFEEKGLLIKKYRVTKLQNGDSIHITSHYCTYKHIIVSYLYPIWHYQTCFQVRLDHSQSIFYSMLGWLSWLLALKLESSVTI